MSDLLLELFSEEIPARMQAQAAKDLERLVAGALSDRGLLFEGIKAFAGPRRLTLAVAGLPAKQPDVKEEKKGPRVGAPDQAIKGFLRSAGVRLEDCETRNDGKGEFYVAVIDLKGRATADVIAEFLPDVLGKLPWPKSMRWPQKTNAPVRWVRPLHSILCTLDGEVVDFTFAGVPSGNTTKGHRFLSSGPIAVKRFEDYREKLRAAHVILDAEERKAIIFEGVKSAAFVHGLEMIPDEGLLDEVSGLAEWPVVLVGAIEDQFMDVPAEILQTSMRTHQKYFSLRTPSFEASLRDAPQDDVQEKSRHPEAAAQRPSKGDGGSFANRFAVVANMIAEDGGKEIVAGNERVLRARLSDAKFFWDQDRKVPLRNRVADLKNAVFHAKAGTMLDRAWRIALLSSLLAEMLGHDIVDAERAGLLAKADLTSGVVGEFPELQGVMGRYYARESGERDTVAEAVAEHYKPLGPSDTVPTAPISTIVALADKIDSLVTLWKAGEEPTGSKDPFALRRAGLGIIRIVLENGLRLPLRLPMLAALAAERPQGGAGWAEHLRDAQSSAALLTGVAREIKDVALADDRPGDTAVADKVMAFLADRLTVALREKGVRHDLIAAVFGIGREDDLVRLVARVEALQAFLKSDDGANLLTAYKRAANILKAEEKKDKTAYDGAPDPEAFAAPEEKALFVELATASELIKAEIARERFGEAMGVMARLRRHVDAFFDKVTVNDKDGALRKNRLLLLSRLRGVLHTVADFSKIEG